MRDGGFRRARSASQAEGAPDVDLRAAGTGPYYALAAHAKRGRGLRASPRNAVGVAAPLPTVSRRRHSLLPVGTLAAGLLSVCASASPVSARPSAHDPRSFASADTVRVSGKVEDLATGEPVSGARVRLVSVASGAQVAVVESDSVGEFVFPALAEGDYVVHVERIGYGEVEEAVRMEGRADLRLFASLVPDAVDLDPVIVTVGRRGSSVMDDFERRRALGFGSFVTREDIEKRHPFRVTDALRSIPGVRLVPGSFGDNALMLRGRCRPSIYIDGIATDPTASLDLSLRPDDVEAIEVHSTATVPARYAFEACGVVLVWTRVPTRVEGRAGWWKPLLVAGTLMGALIVAR